jgi:hypothetical protein
MAIQTDIDLLALVRSDGTESTTRRSIKVEGKEIDESTIPLSLYQVGSVDSDE